MSEPFHILTVCTGNICRSPFMERLLAARLEAEWGHEAADVVISSAGTWGHGGSKMEPYAAECLTEFGGDPDGFVARELTEEIAAEADLVLGATREHRASVVTMAPSVLRVSFTLLEFSRLLIPVKDRDLPAGSLVDRLRALTIAAAMNRGLVALDKPSDDDIDDPYGGPRSVYARMATVVDDALQRPLALLAGRPTVSP